MATSRKRNTARLHLLTARQVQHLEDGDHTDGGGLLLRVRGESSSWVFRFTSPNGRRREMGLGVAHRGSVGQAGDSLAAARDLAHAARETLRRGVDPIDERDARRAELRQVDEAKQEAKERERWTLARCARDYHERVIEPNRTDRHAKQWLSSLENHVPAKLWHKPIADVEPPELLEALCNLTPDERARNVKNEKLPETMQRIRQRLDAVFEDAMFHRRCATNPAAAIRRKLREAMPRKYAGKFEALPYREAPALMARLRASPGVAARCLELAMLTAARTAEVLYAEWQEFDLERAEWIVPAERMKMKETHTVYLSTRAVELLRELRAQKLHPTIVFPSITHPGQFMSNMAMLAVLGRLGVRDATTVHGLCRATFSTWANDTEAARPDVIEACLAHNEADRVRAAYNRAEFNRQRRELLAAWSEYLSLPAARVIDLHAA